MNPNFTTTTPHLLLRFVSSTAISQEVTIYIPRVEKIESFRKLKVELDGGALDGPPEGVLDGDIDLGAIEGAVAGVQFPTMTELVQAFRQLAAN